MKYSYYNRDCIHCKKEFTARRDDKRFCSAKCRSAHYNQIHDIPERLRTKRLEKREVREQTDS